MSSAGRGNYLGVDDALDHDCGPEPDRDTTMETEAESRRDAGACPECHGNGWTEGPGCNCDAPDDGTGHRHRPYCGLEPCPFGCPFVAPGAPQTEAPY